LKPANLRRKWSKIRKPPNRISQSFIDSASRAADTRCYDH